MTLKDKVAIVTGGNSGIGLAHRPENALHAIFLLIYPQSRHSIPPVLMRRLPASQITPAQHPAMYLISFQTDASGIESVFYWGRNPS